MRRTELLVLTFALFLFVLVKPLSGNRDQMPEEMRQEEQATPEDEIEAREGETYKIVFRAQGPREDSVADIIWLKKAAEVAMDAGIPTLT